MKFSKRDKLYVFILSIFPVIVFYPQYFTDKIIFWLDSLFYFYPFRDLVSKLIHKNILPLWNPYIYCGNPLLGNHQSAVFYPLNIFFYIFSIPVAMKITTFFAYFIMGVFMYGFMRLYKVSEEGAFITSVLFTYTYFMIIKAPELADLHTMVWLPVILFFTKKFFETQNIYNLILIAFSLTLSLAGGHPQIFIYVYILFLCFYFYEAIKQQNSMKNNLKNFFIVNCVFIIVFIIQLIPTIKFILLSRRTTTGLINREVNGMDIFKILQIFFPFITAYVPEKFKITNWAGLINIGFPAIFLFVLGVWKFKDKKLRTILLILIVFSLFLSTIESTYYYNFFASKIPILKIMKYHIKASLLLFFVFVFFAGFGYDYLFSFSKKELNKYKNSIIFIVSFLFLILLAGIFFQKTLIKIYMKTFYFKYSFKDVYEKVLYYQYFLTDYMYFVIGVLVLTGILYLIIEKQMKNKFIKILLLFYVIIASQMYHGFAFIDDYFKYRDIVKKEPKIVKFLENDNDMKNQKVLIPFLGELKKKFLQQNMVDLTNKTKEEKEKIKKQFRKKYKDFFHEFFLPNRPMSYGIYNVDGFDSLIIGRYHKFRQIFSSLNNPWYFKGFSLFGAKYIASIAELPDKKLKLAYKNYGFYLYENKNCISPLYFISMDKKFYFTDNFDEIKNILRKNTFSPYEEIIIEKKYKNKFNILKYNKKRYTPEISYIRKNINEIKININTQKEGIIVFLENYYPGWKVFVDGKKEKILKVYYTFKGVFVPKGKHIVVFKYRPHEFFLGIIISIFALLGLIIFIFIRIKK